MVSVKDKNIHVCAICNREGLRDSVKFSKKYNNFLCKKHKFQYNNFGKFLDNSQMSTKDKNEIIIKEEYAEIILRNKKYNEIGRSLIDIDDIEKIKDIKWGLETSKNTQYCRGKYNGKLIKIHRFLLGVLENKNVQIDHINRNRLDNRKSNLRICTRLENSQNSELQINSSSGYLGVNYDKTKGLWMSVIQAYKKRIRLGGFKTKEEALVERLKAEKEYFGEYAPQKHLFEQYVIDQL